MKYILLKNDFGVDREKDKQTPPDQDLTASWIRAVVEKGYAAGLNQDKRRIWSTISAKLEIACKDSSQYLEVNPFEYAFLTAAFHSAVMDPKFTEPVILVEGAVLNAVDEKSVQVGSNPTGEVPNQESELPTNTAKAE